MIDKTLDRVVCAQTMSCLGFSTDYTICHETTAGVEYFGVFLQRITGECPLMLEQSD
jgi:hypothetical protein